MLDFHDNLVSDLGPILFCKRLETVRGGKNRIRSLSSCGDGIGELQELRTLNLSGNELLYFSDISILALIPNLSDLALSDPHFGSNPICDLRNYHIHSLYRLPQIDSLDGIEIDISSKEKAQISMLKKSKFYRIRSEVVERDEMAFCRFVDNVAIDLQRVLRDSVGFSLKLDAIDRAMDGVDGLDNAERAEIAESIGTFRSLAEELRSALQRMKQCAEQQLQSQHRILDHELSTAGNVRVSELGSTPKTLPKSLLALMAEHITNWTAFEQLDQVQILNAVQIEDKFAECSVHQKWKKLRRSGTAPKVFILDQFPCSDFGEAVALILDRKLSFSGQSGSSALKSAISLDCNSNLQSVQTVLFVRGYLSVADGQLFGGEFVPLFLVQLAVNCKLRAHNDSLYEVHDAVQKVFGAPRHQMIRKTGKSLNYLFADFCDFWSQKLSEYLSKTDALTNRMAPKLATMSTPIRRRSDDKLIAIGDAEDGDVEGHGLREIVLCFGPLSFSRILNSINIQFESVEAVDLSFNGMSRIPIAFSNLIRLQTVNLEGNELSLLRHLLPFRVLPNLSALNVIGNPIALHPGLTPFCCSTMRSLRTLNESEITVPMPSTTESEHLSLLSAPPSATPSIWKMVELTLSGLALLAIPAVIGQCVNIESLDLSDNLLSDDVMTEMGAGTDSMGKMVILYFAEIQTVGFQQHQIRALKSKFVEIETV